MYSVARASAFYQQKEPPVDKSDVRSNSENVFIQFNFPLVSSLFLKACVMRIISYLINVDNWKMLARFIPCGFGINFIQC